MDTASTLIASVSLLTNFAIIFKSSELTFEKVVPHSIYAVCVTSDSDKLSNASTAARLRTIIPSP